MDIIRAKEIIEALADGVNPVTGERLPDGDSCNEAEVVRALHAVLNYLNKSSKGNQPENAGKPWTQEEEKILCQMFDEKRTKKEICNHLGRSRGAIAARLVQLGKIDNRSDY